jgi:HEAT repeat protein
MLEGSGNESLEALMSDSAALRVGNVGPEEARRLLQIVKSEQPEARLLAVRALGQMRDLDYVPILLYAMTDPDKRVVREARDGLRFVSRRFNGFALPDNFNETQRYNALDKWKQWYRRVRPNAPLLP